MQGEDIISILMACVMCLSFDVQEEIILEHINSKHHLCALKLTCRPLCSIGIHLITLLNILIPR